MQSSVIHRNTSRPMGALNILWDRKERPEANSGPCSSRINRQRAYQA
jgi:hypothetical protein